MLLMYVSCFSTAFYECIDAVLIQYLYTYALYVLSRATSTDKKKEIEFTTWSNMTEEERSLINTNL